jgi:hypothetical protein
MLSLSVPVVLVALATTSGALADQIVVSVDLESILQLAVVEVAHIIPTAVVSVEGLEVEDLDTVLAAELEQLVKEITEALAELMVAQPAAAQAVLAQTVVAQMAEPAVLDLVIHTVE